MQLTQPSTVSKAAVTCSQCLEFLNGVCQLKARADFGDTSKVTATRPACFFCQLA